MSSSHAAHAIDHHHDHTTVTGIPNKKLFMWAFLASDCMFFGALISTHLIYRLHPTPNVPDVQKIFSIELTSFSTFILLMSSLLMALAVYACQKGNVKSVRRMLVGTIFFGLIFLGGQVYEFNHFVKAYGVTLSNSIFGSTFYTLTGTHGVHVAIGILWLVLMYIRTFKPADESKPWVLRSFIHLITFAITIVASMYFLLGVVDSIETVGLTVAALPHAFGIQNNIIALATGLTGLAVLFGLAHPRGEVDFGEQNAIDVEGMGLYWHFVDIVWIVIFTVVYLIEYI